MGVEGQLQWHAKIVAIQTEAHAAVQSTQPADALHELCTIHTVSNSKVREDRLYLFGDLSKGGE